MLLWNITRHALVITVFVGTMMVALEYVNVQTRGWWFALLERNRLQALLVGALLGALPGCLGAFVIVSLYGAKRVSLGVVVATMIATSGDEMFVMLALIPGTAIYMTLGLVSLGVVAGSITDRLLPSPSPPHCDAGFTVHDEARCRCFVLSELAQAWRHPSIHRITLVVVASTSLASLVLGLIGPQTWDWKRTSLSLVVAFGLFVLITVPEHFLKEHLWRHVARRHVPRIFAWTLGALLIIKGLDSALDLNNLVTNNNWLVLGLAGLIGIVPESGPHLLFVTLYADDSLPLSVLMASSAIQDGHGMLPLLALSRLDFVKVKAINLAAGLLLGGTMLLLGL